MKERYNPCDECEYSYSKQNQESEICKICEYRDAIKELSSLRKKQTPIEVKDRKVLRDIYGHPYTIRGNCPICGSSGLLASNTDYCNACGQKLKWN